MKFNVPVKGIAGDVVASFAEAWIEIFLPVSGFLTRIVASFAEAWIEIPIVILPVIAAPCRLLRGGVD